jgi:SAM-dependent methyltransferase
MAEALVDRAPVALAGARVLDLGAGTGVASEVLTTRGARVVGVDLALDMLAHDQPRRPPGAQADAVRLPFPDGRFDAVVAAFCINHPPGARAMLTEAARVTAPGGVILASTFDLTAPDPLKRDIDDAVRRFGWVPPSWYGELKLLIESTLSTATDVAEQADAGGVVGVEVHEVAVDLPGIDAGALATYRLGAAQLAPFVAGLSPAERCALHAEAAAATEPHLPWRPAIFVLIGRAPG